MLWGAISPSIASHAARARSRALPAAKAAMSRWQAGWSGSLSAVGSDGVDRAVPAVSCG